jgi:hypothetical protein
MPPPAVYSGTIYYVYGKNAMLGELEPVREICAHELGIVVEAIAAGTAAEGVAGLQRERGDWESSNATKDWEFSGQEKTHGLSVDYIGIFDDVAQALDFDECNPAVKSMIAQVI